MNIKSCLLLLLLGLPGLAFSQQQRQLLPEARLSIQAVDDSGESVPSASVRLGFQNRTNGEMEIVSGLTDSKGSFAGQGGTVSVVGCDVRKEGYYLAGASIPAFTNRLDDRWQPWDATYTSIIRKIEKPVPMYAKRVFLHMPQRGKPCGFDLKEGDWVSPWGRGRVPDFVFTLNWDYKDFRHQDVAMKLTFSNPLDGIQPANLPKEYAYGEFIWHRQAPEAGYLDHYEMEFGIPKQGFQIPSAPQIRSGADVEAQKFYFRVRTVERDGKIVSALYGKLSQGFFIGALNPTNANVRTCYYLNPTPLDRNMEFDPKQNLFKSLKFTEQPRKP